MPYMRLNYNLFSTTIDYIIIKLKIFSYKTNYYTKNNYYLIRDILNIIYSIILRIVYLQVFYIHLNSL